MFLLLKIDVHLAHTWLHPCSILVFSFEIKQMNKTEKTRLEAKIVSEIKQRYFY
jgi:hypothetical protein